MIPDNTEPFEDSQTFEDSQSKNVVEDDEDVGGADRKMVDESRRTSRQCSMIMLI